MQRFLDDLHGAADALLGGGVRREHDGVASLQRNERLVDDRGGGVGGRDDARDHADGNRDFHDLVDLVLAEYAHRLHILDAGVDLLAGKQVLDLLVLGLAVAGLFVGHDSQRLGLGGRGFGNGLDHRVDAFLPQLRKLGLGGTGGAHQGTGFLDGQQILVYH